MPSSNQISLLSYKEFEQTYKEDGITYALVVAGKSEVANEVLVEVRSLLDRFKGIAPEELLARLPTLQDIQHQIDFIPGAILFNSPHYKMPLSEHVELQKQGIKLLGKGLIREFHSPCAIPALLTPKKD